MIKSNRRKTIQWSLYLMLLPAFIIALIYNYGPLFGLAAAFEKFDTAKGIFHSQWVGLENFIYIFKYPNFTKIIFNTFYIASMKIVASFMFPIFIALLLSEIQNLRLKKSIQTLIYLPHFISWVIISAILIDVLSPSTGVVNTLLSFVGVKPIYFLGEPKVFPYLLVASDVWKEFGFGTVVYLAALTGIDPSLYEAANVDGASRFQRIWHISVPGIVPIMVLLGTLSLGSVLNAGFDQVFNLYNPLVYSTGDILDTLTYRLGIVDAQYDLATAIGLFKSLVSLVMVSTSYYLAYKVADYRIF
ncbi:MAG TPA: ABC transporter permease subunit [Clostridiaceae bacterium]